MLLVLTYYFTSRLSVDFKPNTFVYIELLNLEMVHHESIANPTGSKVVLVESKPDQVGFKVDLLSAKKFFTTNVPNRKQALSQLSLSNLLSYIEQLEAFRGDHRAKIQSYTSKYYPVINVPEISDPDLDKSGSNSFAAKIAVVENKKFRKNMKGEGNKFGYKNQLAEEVRFDESELDSLINVIERKVEDLKLKFLLHKQDDTHHEKSGNAHKTSGRVVSSVGVFEHAHHQKPPKTKPIHAEVVDLTFRNKLNFGEFLEV